MVAVGVAALFAAAHVFARPASANGFVSIGDHAYLFGGGSCQTVAGDFSVSIADKGHSFHLIWTPKSHGSSRSVAWRWTYLTNDAVIGAKIAFAPGRSGGTFSGLSTNGVRITGSFSCG